MNQDFLLYGGQAIRHAPSGLRAEVAKRAQCVQLAGPPTMACYGQYSSERIRLLHEDPIGIDLQRRPVIPYEHIRSRKNRLGILY